MEIQSFVEKEVQFLQGTPKKIKIKRRILKINSCIENEIKDSKDEKNKILVRTKINSDQEAKSQMQNEDKKVENSKLV